MNDPRKPPEIRAAEVRAAEVRRRWSPDEKMRRKGLPPDAPWSLLRRLLAPCCQSAGIGFTRPTRQWCQVTVAARRG
jgi:hypothetical protein